MARVSDLTRGAGEETFADVLTRRIKNVLRRKRSLR
jgi:hypothetical protein